MNALTMRELRSQLLSPIGLVLVCGFSIAMTLLGLYVMPRSGAGDWFDQKSLTMNTFFAAFPWCAAVILPAVTMRTWAEDARAGTDQLLMTLPMPLWKQVLAKFAACKLFLFAMLLATAPYMVMVVLESGQTGSGAEWGPVLAGYLGCMLLGSTFLAIGMFTSALTSSQVTAYVASLLVCAGLVSWTSFAGVAAGSASGGDVFSQVLLYLSVSGHFENIALGLVRLDALVWFISLASFFLILNIVVLEGRRYR